MKLTKILQQILSQVPTSMYLGMAVLIFAASNSVTRKIVQIGESHTVNGHNPISLCNVLFVGNLCALGVMIFIFYHDWKPSILKALTLKNWIALTIMGVLSGAIVPALIFTALGQTNVTNIVLIGRIEPILTLVLGVFILGSRVNAWTISGSLVSFAGVIVTAFLKSSGEIATDTGGNGEILVAIAAVISAISTIMGKLQLQSIPLGIFTIYRNVLGTIIFFLLAQNLYGSEHFAEVLSPFLWKWMIIYSSVIVVTGQLCWLTGLKNATSTELNLASLFNPIAAIGMAYLILREVPTSAQYIGGSLLFLGLILGFLGNQHQATLEKANTAEQVNVAKMDSGLSDPSPREGMVMSIGFRGV
ncbi:MAG: DMT family transporter [Prochlorotrichaceae cyanobacterium]|jgi:drug/metabolite transporter (DMT)-like permease